MPKGAIVTEPVSQNGKVEQSLDRSAGTESPHNDDVHRVATHESQPRTKSNSQDLSSSPNATSLMRRTSGGSFIMDRGFVSRRLDSPEVREHLKHLGPSNLASRPRTTRYNTVKIKAGGFKASESPLKDIQAAPQTVVEPDTPLDGGVGEGLLQSAGKEAKDGVHAVQVGYGTIEHPKPLESPEANGKSPQLHLSPSPRNDLQRANSSSSARSTSTIGSLPAQGSMAGVMSSVNRAARSGSITENIIETGGIKKVILETTSSSSEEGQQGEAAQPDVQGAAAQSKASRKKRRKKRKKAESEEVTPLLDNE